MLFTDVVTVELDDSVDEAEDGGGNVFGLTGYLWISTTWNLEQQFNPIVCNMENLQNNIKDNQFNWKEG